MRDIIKKIFITFAVLLVFEVGKTVTIPGVTSLTHIYSSALGNFLGAMSMLSGGSLSTFSIFALGVGPYITSSIVLQLLGSAGVPYIKQLMDEGGKGRTKFNRLMRYASILIAIIQAFGITAMFEKNYGVLQDSSFMGYGLVILCMTAGMCVVMWLADLITMKGIGNGVSVIIFAGIVSELPTNIYNVYRTLTEKNNGLLLFCLYMIVYVILVFLVVLVEQSDRRIPIQQSNRVINRTLGDFSYIPLKVNSASVMPVIFASTFMSAPSLIMGLFNLDTEKVNTFMDTGSVSGMIIYALLIVGFTFLYTGTQVNVDEMSENLAQNGTYIPGVRPNEETKRYIKRVLNSITWVGALFLVFIALLPNFIALLTGISSRAAMGGTGLIVAVGVAIELINNVKTLMKNGAYSSYRRM